MQQHPLIAGAKAKQRANLVRGQAVDVAQRHDGPLPLRQLSQAILQWRRLSAAMVSSSGERGHDRGLPSGVQLRGQLSSASRKRSGATAGLPFSAGLSEDHGTVRALLRPGCG